MVIVGRLYSTKAVKNATSSAMFIYADLVVIGEAQESAFLTGLPGHADVGGP